MNTFILKRQLTIFVFILSLFVLTSQSAFAYTTGMDASVVIGQPDFTSATANQGGSTAANTLRDPRQAIIAQGKLIVNDAGNDRILIWNTIPKTNNVSANVVIGKSVMTDGNDNGCAANQLEPADGGIVYVQGKLIVGDAGNNRVLIFNSIPTTNGASPNVVVGQSDLISCNLDSASASSFGVSDVASDGTKLFISDSGNNRILIFNTIPKVNGASADVVVGQPDFSTSSAGTTQSKLFNPRGIAVYNGRLIIGERGNFRVTIFNTIPKTNGVSADVVLGQANYTTATTSPPSNASTVHPFFMSVDNKGRLYVADRNASRYLIWNSIPNINNTPADIVIGQPNFTSTTTNNGGVTANSVGNAKGIFANESYMVITDQANNRVLIYENIIKTPQLSVNNPEGIEGNKIRMKGTARTESPYVLNSVQYSINGSGFRNATATDGNFNTVLEDYSFDFDPKDYKVMNSAGEYVDGYSVRVKSVNNNADTIDNLFYFTPFNIIGPEEKAQVNSNNLTFEFGVFKQKSVMKENISKYQIQIKKGDANSQAEWQTYIDEIPVEGTPDISGKVTFENDHFTAEYTEDMSRIKVVSKHNTLAGTTQWRVVAVDKSGHAQYTGSKTLLIKSIGVPTANLNTISFPLAVLNISGLGNPDMSTTNVGAMKERYTVNSTNPIFYGIANVGSKVTLEMTDTKCSETNGSDCIKTFDTTTNAESRYGINVPSKTLQSGNTYSTRIFVSQDNNYNELPIFDLLVK